MQDFLRENTQDFLQVWPAFYIDMFQSTWVLRLGERLGDEVVSRKPEMPDVLICFVPCICLAPTHLRLSFHHAFAGKILVSVSLNRPRALFCMPPGFLILASHLSQ